MRCLIPITQDRYPKHAIERCKICDEVILLYIVERNLVNKVLAESSYILPPSALEELEKSIIDVHRREAEKIKQEMCTSGELQFVVGEYYERIEGEILRSNPDLIMVDDFLRGLFRMNVPVWIDRGGKIREATFIISSLRRLKKIKKDLDFAREICKRLGADIYLYYSRRDEEGRRTLKEWGKLTEDIKGDLVILQRDGIKRMKSVNMVII